MREKDVQRAIMLAMRGRTDLRIWPQQTGVGVPLSAVKSAVAVLAIGHPARKMLESAPRIRYGLPGAADLSGILADGRRLEVEVKSATGRQSEQQKAFELMMERYQGLYVLARSPEDVVAAL